MEKRFAKVLAGVVERISSAAQDWSHPDWIPMDGVADAEIGIDDLYDGNVFSKKPAPPKTPEELAAIARRQAIATAKAEAQADTVVQYLRDHTTAECAQYVDSNVTDLASAKAFLKKVAVVLCVLSKKEL